MRASGSPWFLIVSLLAGCAGTPPPRPVRDGPDPNPPAGLARRPDAVPRVDPIRSGGPNKPYEVFGRRYVPLTSDVMFSDAGLASWYGRKFHGQPTSSGEPYDMYAMTAAHKTMPIPSYAVVANPANGRSVVVRVNDRGPFVDGRVIDLSYTAALKLGVLGGVAPVTVRRLTHGEIRAGLAPAAPVLSPEDPAPGDAAPLWLQLGSFTSRQAAQRLLQRALFDAETVVQLDEGDGRWRVWAGPFADAAAAQAEQRRLRALLGIDAVPSRR